MEFLIIPIMAILASLAGGSFPYSQLLNKRGEAHDDGTDKGGVMPFDLTWLPEALFAILASVVWILSFLWWGLLFVTAWVYLWFQTGHANALNWGKNADPDRANTLTPIVEFFYRGGFGRAYSAVFFSVKGFLLSLPFFGLGALYWPLAYDIGTWLEYRAGWKHENAHRISELLSGFFFGCNVLLVYKTMS